jgi:tRNA(His) 5'-end guanylyltransferase
MKKREIYSDLRCAPPFIIRVDGRTFRNSLSRMGFEKPFDSRFAASMGNAVEMLFKKVAYHLFLDILSQMRSIYCSKTRHLMEE